MKPRTREIGRKIAHLVIGTTILLVAYYILQNYGSDVLDLLVILFIGGLVVCDILIASYGIKIPLYHQLQRKNETQGLHALTLAVFTCFLVYKIFAFPIAFAAMLMLVYGDAAAGIVGLFTKSGQNKKTTPRISAMLIVSVAIGWLVFGWIGAIMGIVATLAECLVTKIDDSVTIPLFSSLAGHILMLLFL